MSAIVPEEQSGFLRELRLFHLNYKFGLDEILTKINILREEMTFRDGANPIEHVTSRIKTIDSLRRKAERIGCPLELDAIAEQIRDIAGVRIVCSFISDVYRVLEMLTSQPDVTVRQVKDYVAQPKANGYRSLHAIVEIPVFLSDTTHAVPIEVQIRTVAMDFWASVEHKIYYKYAKDVPAELVEELSAAARVAHDLDTRMGELHRIVHG
ncbi:MULTISPECIES: GTP pyrophosphokinase family protein [unclassified Nocardioides]|uniref:GTP pyrophosphokinase n=1 Tax=unclassified Nocardioides TaxID=2615069 RepID=UPI00116B812F|nr:MULTISPECIES: GTP pyrophosphokinase family protein [unclassified Nocardioides]TQK69135.1 putative GTP pyrophosphokinase [Nocardioides sp. SLBN-35]WGY01558.1 GTP pyrophosphokinase family protein [Nocardioides sp. QY071]